MISNIVRSSKCFFPRCRFRVGLYKGNIVTEAFYFVQNFNETLKTINNILLLFVFENMVLLNYSVCYRLDFIE